MKRPEYMDKDEYTTFAQANRAVHGAEKMLMGIGATREEAHKWIRLWASTAGDGAQ